MINLTCIIFISFNKFFITFLHIQKSPEIDQLNIIKIIRKDYLKERNFRVDLFSRVIFINISVLYILIISWFLFQLVVYGSGNSHPNFTTFQIALFWYKRLNSQLNA